MSELAILCFFLTPLCLVGDRHSALSSFKDFERGVKGSGVRSDSLVSQLTYANYVLSSERQAVANLSNLF